MYFPTSKDKCFFCDMMQDMSQAARSIEVACCISSTLLISLVDNSGVQVVAISSRRSLELQMADACGRILFDLSPK